MDKCICSLEPKAIWENFYKLTQVPRPSNHEEKARKFMLEWAKENNIEASMDEAGNIIMRKAATPGMENRKGVILQGHLDMTTGWVSLQAWQCLLPPTSRTDRWKCLSPQRKKPAWTVPTA